MKSLIKKKKGDMFQVIVMLAILLAVAMVGMLTFVMTTKVNQYWDDSGLLNESEKGTDAINTLQAISPRMTDYAIFFLFLGMNIGITIAAIRTNYNPATIMIFIFLLFLAILIAAGSVNIYRGIADLPSIIDITSQLTLTNFLFSKYTPLLISGICTFVLLLMFGKSGGNIAS